MKFTLRSRADWPRVVLYYAKLTWQHLGKPVFYNVIIEEVAPTKTLEQNAAQHAWYAEAERQHGEYDAEGYRAYCKAHFGIPILCRDSAEYRDAYDRLIRPLAYERKLEMMRRPIDFPVTRGMNKRQLSEYLEAVYQHLAGLGVDLEQRAA